MTYQQGDAMSLPLPDACANVVSIAFGIRNVAVPARAMGEFVRVLKPGGRVVLVGLGRTETTLPTMPLIAKSVLLKGSGGGQPSDTAAVLEFMAQGELTKEALTIDFNGIPAGLQQLQRGGVVGRIVARPFDKFFYWMANGMRASGHIVTVTEKADGSLGILYRHKEQYR